MVLWDINRTHFSLFLVSFLSSDQQFSPEHKHPPQFLHIFLKAFLKVFLKISLNPSTPTSAPLSSLFSTLFQSKSSSTSRKFSSPLRKLRQPLQKNRSGTQKMSASVSQIGASEAAVVHLYRMKEDDVDFVNINEGKLFKFETDGKNCIAAHGLNGASVAIIVSKQGALIVSIGPAKKGAKFPVPEGSAKSNAIQLIYEYNKEVSDKWEQFFLKKHGAYAIVISAYDRHGNSLEEQTEWLRGHFAQWPLREVLLTQYTLVDPPRSSHVLIDGRYSPLELPRVFIDGIFFHAPLPRRESAP